LPLGLALAALFAATQFIFVLRAGDCAVLTTFGRPVRSLTAAGLYRRWPYPAQRLHRFDARLRTLEGGFDQTLTQDGKSVVIALYASWRIADPLRFLERVGAPEPAAIALDGLLATCRNAVVGREPFAALVNTDPAALRFAQIEQAILAAAAPEARERYGIDITEIGIRRLSLPEAITAKVFERMRAEREEVAERYRSEGQGEAIRIRAEADRERDQLLAQAEADARRLRAEGEAAAAESYRAFQKDPELALFLRKLETLEQTLGKESTIILGPDTEPFDLLLGPGGKK